MKRTITTEAWDDVARAVRVYNAKPGRYGSAIRSEFRAAVRAIAENPRSHPLGEWGPSDAEVRIYHIRRFDLLVIYEVRKRDVLILSLVHANMPPEKWLARPDPTPPT
jgi:ParE toxin of type II toxin-antitoxin system, parDE